MWTVKETATLAGVTVKTLHHYHRIGLLIPGETSPAGYRLYSPENLERLQEILFFRALEFPLREIKNALGPGADRRQVLRRQRSLLLARRKQFAVLLETLDEALGSPAQGASMDPAKLFTGLDSTQWNQALREQNDYLKDRYGFELETVEPPQGPGLNEMAAEAITFQDALAQALVDHKPVSDPGVRARLAEHLAFLNAHGHPVTPLYFVGQTKFLRDDDFHRNMLEGRQTGLAYYLAAAAEAFAAGA